MGVMMKIPTCYAISIPNRFAFGLNVYRNDCTAACQDFLGREERMEYENIKKSENFFEKLTKNCKFCRERETKFLFGIFVRNDL